MVRKIPRTFDDSIAECDEAMALGYDNVEDYRKAKPIAITLNEFLERKLPEREFIIQPCLQKQGLVMIYAQRGIGKTYFALLLACSMANGVSLFGGKWKISKKHRVLYIDGEMAANSMQERIKTIIANHPDFANDNFSIITRDIQLHGIMPDISTIEGQDSLESEIEKSDIIIIDNLSTLARSGKENEANSWNPIADWLLRLRSQGKSVIIIHHAGKNNSQRGTSKKEDILDTVINLKRPSDYSQEQGARFEVHFEKARSFSGEDAKPFEVTLQIEGDEASWKVSEVNSLELNRVIELSKQGLSQRRIAEEIGLSLGKVNQLLQQSN